MKIYFLVATQHDNLGDLLINKMLIDEISKYGTVYVDGAGLPDNFRDVLIENNNVKDFEKEYKGSLKRISGYRLLSVVKSDFDYYFKSPGPSGGMVFDFMSVVRTVVLAYQFNYLSKGKLKLNLVGNDIIIRTKLDKWFQKNTNKAFDNYLVRSKENRDQLIGMGYENASFIPDMAFLFEAKDISINKNTVLLSFRDLKNKQYTEQLLVYLQKCIDRFTEDSLEIVFFHQVASDKEYNKFLYQSLVGKTRIIEKTLSYHEISNVYRCSKYVVTNRLHVFLLGMRHEAIPLAFLNEDNKTSKISNIVKTFGLKENYVNVSTFNFDENRLRKEIQEINANQNLICQKRIEDLFVEN